MIFRRRREERKRRRLGIVLRIVLNNEIKQLYKQGKVSDAEAVENVLNDDFVFDAVIEHAEDLVDKKGVGSETPWKDFFIEIYNTLIASLPAILEFIIALVTTFSKNKTT